ncbi:MAG: EAL domain-containing protein [Gammaproteobacteria bacterium]
MSKSRHSGGGGKTGRALPLLVLFTLLAAGVLLIFLLLDQRQRLAAGERQRLQAAAVVVERNMTLQLRDADRVLRGIRERVLRGDGLRPPRESTPNLQILVDGMPAVRTLLVIDAAGQVRASNRAELLGTDFSDRHYFDIARVGGELGLLYVSPPFETVLDVTSVNLMRVIPDAVGGFGGIVAASLNADYFAELLDSVLYATDMRAVIAHADGEVFVGRAAEDLLSRAAFELSGDVLNLDREASRAMFAVPDLTDSALRHFARARIGDEAHPLDRPLLVVVSRDAQALLAPWRRQVVLYGGCYAVLAMLLGGSLLYLRQRYRQIERLQRDRDAEEDAATERLELALAGADLGLWDWHVPSGRMICDARWCAMLGYAPEELAAEFDAWRTLVRPADWPDVDAALQAHLAGASSRYECEYAMRHKQGRWVWILDRGQVMERDAAGAPLRVLGTHLDITASHEEHEALVRLGHHYAALSRTNEAIIHAEEAPALLDAVCRIAVEQGGLELVWVGRHEAAEGRLERLAAAGPALAYLDEVGTGVDAGNPVAGEPFGLVLRDGEPRAVANLHEDPGTLQWREVCVRWQLRSLLVCPIRRGGRNWGVIAFYASEARYFAPDLVTLLTDLSGDVAYSLDAFDKDRERAELQARLELTVRMLDASREGVFITDRDNRFIMVNPAYCAMTGYVAEELLGLQPQLLQSGRQDAAFYDALWAAVRERGHWQGELFDRRKNGEVFPVWLSITAVRDAEREITNHIGVFSDISERKAVQQHIEHLAQHDLLTGLPNRALLSDRMRLLAAQARRECSRLAVLYVDLDRFKVVNDSLGHAVGDKLLRAVAERISAALRASDTLSRFGGDEFVVLLPGIDAVEDAARVATKIIDAIDTPFRVDGHELLLGGSIGIAIHPDNGADVEDMITLADTAMFAAKHDGGRQFRFYAEDMGSAVRERMALEQDLRGAAARGELFPVFQPQHTLADGRLMGIEVLARWRHPQRGVVSPANFIPVAEESGLILEIGGWMLHAACAQTEDWRSRGLLDVPVSVNVSAVQFRQAGFVDVVKSVLDATGLPPSRLELEVTESVVMEHVEAVIAKLDELATLGVRLAIDDFGTGYSSLTYLRRLPAQRLKIDQSFVRDLPADADASAIAAAVVSLGHALSMQVIAEGVETAAQAAFLRELGCDEGQGYLYAKPLSATDFERWITDRATHGGMLYVS